jgi:hypothetical protein
MNQALSILYFENGCQIRLYVKVVEWRNFWLDYDNNSRIDA